MFTNLYPLCSIDDLKNESLTMKDITRISKSKKAYAVLMPDKLHLVDDLDRLFNDRLRHERIFEARIYPLKE